MHSNAQLLSFFMRKFLPFLLVIYFSAGSLSTQLRALQLSSVGEKYLQVIRISFFELWVPVFLQYRRKKTLCELENNKTSLLFFVPSHDKK